MKKIALLLGLCGGMAMGLRAQDTAAYTLLVPDQVFDGVQMHPHWQVLLQGKQVKAVGTTEGMQPPAGTKVVSLPGCTVLPGLIEGHSHLFLHPYNEVTWDEQVLNESVAERTARAVVHARKTLEAGFTTVRDLGTEGAGYADVGLKQAIEKGVIPGPRMIVATRAIVATGSYGPKLDNTDQAIYRGAATADGMDALIKEVRTQIGNGADVVKVYADYRWGLDKTTMPTFTLEELKTVVDVASSSGRMVVAHASSAEAMRRCILAGIRTIEHGDNATADILDMMVKYKVALTPTISAGEAIARYRGWNPATEPEPERITTKRKSFQLALQKGVTICMGGDVGVYAHGDNAREMEAMVAYGMAPLAVLQAATSVNADVFGYGDKIGHLKPGYLADVLVVKGDPSKDIHAIRAVQLVLKDGQVVYQP